MPNTLCVTPGFQMWTTEIAGIRLVFKVTDKTARWFICGVENHLTPISDIGVQTLLAHNQVLGSLH